MTYPHWRITNREHPHYPETGQATGEIVTFIGGGKMAKMTLDACRHGTDACFVSPGDVKEILPPRQSDE